MYNNATTTFTRITLYYIIPTVIDLIISVLQKRLRNLKKKADFFRFLILFTPYTGFEPRSPLEPTVFKTAPSPPGHTAHSFDSVLGEDGLEPSVFHCHRFTVCCPRH